MKTILKRFAAGVTVTVLAGAFSGCSPMIVAHPRPRPVVYTTEVIAPVPVQTVTMTPVISVWAPPVPYVTEVHYFYFPDYMMYYDLVHQHYCYNNGSGWLYVTILPSLPVFYGFDPHHSFLIVLNQSAYQPWIRHDYYVQHYPVGYYNTMYAPRTALGSNTILRAYDENRNRPMFVDKRSNKEVAVKYDTRPARNSVGNNPVKSNSLVSQSKGRSLKSNDRSSVNGRTEPAKKNDAGPVTRNIKSIQQQPEMISRSHETDKRNRIKERKSQPEVRNQPERTGREVKNNKSVNRLVDSRSAGKTDETKKFLAQAGERESKANLQSDYQNKGEQKNRKSK